MNASAMTTPTRAGRPVGPTRRLVMRELQHHARNTRFSPQPTLGLSPQQIASATGLPIQTIRTTLANMAAAGQATNAGNTRTPLWRLPNASDQASNDMNPMHKHAGTYDGAELRPYTGRPGAMDAFTLPSLANGQRVAARRPSAQLVGALTDRTNNARG